MRIAGRALCASDTCLAPTEAERRRESTQYAGNPMGLYISVQRRYPSELVQRRMTHFKTCHVRYKMEEQTWLKQS